MLGSRELHQDDITLERAQGKVSIVFNAQALERFYQAGSAKAFLPATYGRATELVIANTAGGLADGDEFTYEIEAGQNSYLAVTTQAAERVYKALGAGMARSSLSINVRDNSKVFWLPHETILYDGSRFSRKIDVSLDASSSVLLGEMVVFGRLASGEVMGAGHMQDHWQIRHDGQLIHAEAFRLTGDIRASLDHLAGAGRAGVMATLLMLAPEDLGPLATSLRDISIPDGARVEVSSWNGKLVVRCIAAELHLIKPVIGKILEQMISSPLPRTWAL